jgi:hypothetical protein
LLIFLHSFVLFIDDREEWAFGISIKALAMNLSVKQKRSFAIEGNLQTAGFAESFALDLKCLLLVVKWAYNVL